MIIIYRFSLTIELLRVYYTFFIILTNSYYFKIEVVALRIQAFEEN